MASLIPGYEYDIFISYRQKDNKYDGWVTEFVDNLKKELEATFKEEISVYFDINPHDGLLETHDVDASLKEKLKCLVFIPIISRTYCDPKSFAWEHEFKAFVELASQDQFGLKIKLPNGNVASRVLPVRIYDLDSGDIKLCESLLGSVMRGIEFIYSEPGVNRPLKPEDDEKINQNKTKYRNQINKVGNAIKEVISGLNTEPAELAKEKINEKERLEKINKEEIIEVQEKPARISKLRALSGVIILAVLIVAAVIAYPKIFKWDIIERLRASGERISILERLRASGERISIAVMPFQNMTNDTLLNIYQKTIQENLTAYLSNFSSELKVIETQYINSLIQSKNLVNDALITPSIGSSISRKLGANIFINGSIQKAGNKLRIDAQLIDTKTNEVIKPFEKDGLYKEETIFDITDSLRKNVTDYLIVSKSIKELESVFKEKMDMWEIMSKSPQANRYFYNGAEAFAKTHWQTAINWHLKAIAIDSNFIWAKLQLAYAYETFNIDSARRWSQNLYNKVAQMSPMVKLSVEMLYARLHRTPYDEINMLKQGLEIDDQSAETYYNLGFCYNKLYDYDNAIFMFKKYFGVFNKLGIKPVWYLPYTQLGIAYHNKGQYKEEKKLYKKAEQDFPENTAIIYRQAILALTEKDTLEANRYIEKYISLQKERSVNEVTRLTNLASIYSEADILDKAEVYYRKAQLIVGENYLQQQLKVGENYQQAQLLSTRNTYANYLNNLAYFLIDKDRNINEGLEIVEKALELRSDYYPYLHTKGWGLYKQRRYEEALKILQKSWDIRREKAEYNHAASLHLEAAKKAVAGLR